MQAEDRKEAVVMRRLEIEKLSDSNVLVPHGTVVYSGSSYELCVKAREFVDGQEEEAALALMQGGNQVASCTLMNDPLRRSYRTGTLRIDDIGGDMLMAVTLGDSVLFTHPVNVVNIAGSGGDDTSQSGPSGEAVV